MDSARESILELMNEYCYRIDRGDLQGFADLFSEGTWLVQGDPTGGDTGSAAVMETLKNIILYDGKPNTKHVMSNIQLTVAPDGKTASAQCYITVNQAVPPDFPLQPIFIGHYYDSFAYTDGVWRFTLRDIQPDLAGDLSHHRADF
ncbi:nuclear transport factor 2 family protein [bacterium]|nr:nuclear transport factor 2 family protein [bacterium]|tara:strand:- start:83 stop:520 length:438 start_codon:yes stop_codon:yes gene_type:complete